MEDGSLERFTKFKNDVLEKVDSSYLKNNPNGQVFFVSGHDHNLQYWKIANKNFIVAGSASETSPYYKKLIKKSNSELKKENLVFPEYTIFDCTIKPDGLRGYVKLNLESNSKVNISLKYYDEGEQDWITFPPGIIGQDEQN